MKLFYFYKPNGYVEHVQMCLTTEDADAVTAIINLPHAERDGAGNSFAYVRNGAVITPPDAPSPLHVFDYSLYEWVDPRTMNELRAATWERIKLARMEALRAGVEVPGLGRFDANGSSNVNITAVLATLSQQPSDWVIAWTRFDNSVATLDLESFPRMAMVVLSHASAVHERGRTRRNEVEVALDRAALDLIEW